MAKLTQQSTKSSIDSQPQRAAEDMPVFAIKAALLAGKALKFDHGKFPWNDLSVLDGDKRLYYAIFRKFKPNSPDVTLHRLQEGGPLAGVSHFRWGMTPKCGIGSDELSMEWVGMMRKGALRSAVFSFEWEGTAYSLTRILKEERNAMGIERTTRPHFKVVEEVSGKFVAVFISGRKLRGRKGTLMFAEGTSEDLEVLVILSIATWREMLKRKG